MQNYFILALAVCGLYLASDFALGYISKKRGQEPKQNTMRSLVIIFAAVLTSLFIFDKVGIMRLAPLKTVKATPAFTNNPDF